MDDLPPEIEITFRIPGTWTSPRELVERLPTGYQLSPEGLTLPNGGELVFIPMPPDNQFAGIFESSCRQPATSDELERVHRYTVNVGLAGPGGSLADARMMMQAAAAIVKAGGAGVFIDNSGLAHGGQSWLELTEDGSPDALSFAFVSIVRGNDEVWTMGMHSLGQPEIQMQPNDRDASEERIIDVLRYMCESERPVAQGHILILDQGLALQVSEKKPCRFASGPMHNPLGSLVLVPAREIAERN